MTDIRVVAPMNMGNRLEYNDNEKRYNVNVDDLIKRIEALEAKVTDLDTRQYTNLTPSIDKPNEVFNLDTDLTGLGMKVFYGNIRVNQKQNQEYLADVQRGYGVENGSGRHIPIKTFVKGMAKYIASTIGEQVEAAYTEADFGTEQLYDFVGYQFATPVEIVQVVVHGGRTMVRTNDSGMTLTGKLANPNAWGKWIRA